MTRNNDYLQKLREEYRTLSRKLDELSDDELSQVTGGKSWDDFLKEIQGHCSSFSPNVEGADAMCLTCKYFIAGSGFITASAGCKLGNKPNL